MDYYIGFVGIRVALACRSKNYKKESFEPLVVVGLIVAFESQLGFAIMDYLIYIG
jgi:hypothetical protein